MKQILAFMADIDVAPLDALQIRLVRSDVAVAYRSYQTRGHKTPDGKEMQENILTPLGY
jgi:hypothetical protein